MRRFIFSIFCLFLELFWKNFLLVILAKKHPSKQPKFRLFWPNEVMSATIEVTNLKFIVWNNFCGTLSQASAQAGKTNSEWGCFESGCLLIQKNGPPQNARRRRTEWDEKGILRGRAPHSCASWKNQLRMRWFCKLKHECGMWWAIEESNLWPQQRQCCALANWANRPCFCSARGLYTIMVLFF